jgi:hypothetical protein
MARLTCTCDEHGQADVVPGDAQQTSSRGTGFGLAVPIPRETGVQIDRVRHDGGAQHRGGEQDALGPLEARHQATGHVGGRRRLDHKAGEEADRDDEQQTADHALEHALPAVVLDRQ